MLSSTGLWAQDYVVTAKGDTIKGEVKLMSFGSNSTVKLTGSDKKKSTYTIFQVQSFAYKNEIYQPVKGPNGYTFMKLKKAGYLSLYAFQIPNQLTFDGLYLTKKDGTSMEVPNLSFKKMMTKFLSECDSVVNKIDKGRLTRRHLDAIVDEYNACIISKTIDYTKMISLQTEQAVKISAWDILEEKLKVKADFDGKVSALEMITEIKGKIKKDEKVPNFLTEGLTKILNPTELKIELENALKELN